ncbi:MAG TPA: MFS transporter [Acetivibrio sp.]|nr:MFS transporter [Acetivibrio sp.]HPT90148.1 MFS transporter [Acetivibrio sp.]
MESEKKWDLFALASIPLIMTLGNSMFIPVLPNIENRLNITKFQSSMIISIYSITSIFLIPIAGFLSDKFGRKKIIIPSLIITGIGGAVSGIGSWLFPNPYWIIIIGRFTQGIGSSGAFPVVIPTVGDMFKDDRDVSKGLGIIETSNTFGKVLSPILGSFLAAIVWFMPFIAIAVFALISILLVTFLVKVPKKNDNDKKENLREYINNLKNIFREKGKWLTGIFFGGLVAMFVLFGFLFYFTSTLEDRYQIQGMTRGLILAVPLLALCLSSFTIGKVIGKRKVLMKWIILFGNLVSACSLVLLSFFDNFIMLIVILSIAGIGIGAALPCLDALVTEGIEKLHRGCITCILSSTRLLGVAVGPPISAILIKLNNNTLFYVLAASNALSALITMLLVKPKS